ncbi:endonuclease/exonuclease/phosphatase family protein [Chitinophaga sp. CF118]|uniref:endonuclease/exonuclease/phosphatase family protein n=1 Tax=Chitinophaga sp. CF118 TaxID=1884367 RepID=UPI0015A51A08|nr:endonuclease/exonuclease/phosphatase family protein [Chitinophaga sp. CF118]
MLIKSPFIRRVPFYINVLITLTLILTAWLPFINPQKCWPCGFMGLFFPLCWCLNLLFIPLWIIYKKQYFWLPVIGILLSFKASYNSWGMHPAAGSSNSSSQQFTLMTFNSSSMGLKDYKEDPALRSHIYQTLQTASPDILCLQEFYTNTRKDLTDHIAKLQENLHYPYYYFTKDKTSWNTWHYGIILFSRFPIIQTLKIPCGHSAVGSGSSILQADVLVAGDTVRIFTAQLQSYMFKSDDYSFLHLKDPGDVDEGKHLTGKMRRTINKRAEQSRLLASLVAASPYPAIVCGDFNDVPVSYTYNTISSGLQDAFLAKGWGIGRTLSFLSPTLRIDYILTQPSFIIHNYKTFREKGFEHFPVMSGLSLKRN